MKRAAPHRAAFFMVYPERIDPGGNAFRGPILKLMQEKELDLLLSSSLLSWFLCSSLFCGLLCSFFRSSHFVFS